MVNYLRSNPKTGSAAIAPSKPNALRAAPQNTAPAYRRFDFTQWGTGLDSQGIARDANKVRDFYGQVTSMPSNPYRAGIIQGVDRYRRNNPGNPSDSMWLTNAIDWYFRDQQRNNQKVHGLGPLGVIAPIAASFIPGIGPALSTAISTGIGAATGGWKGALLGGLGSMVAPSINLPGGVSNALRAPVSAATSVARQFANPATLGRQIASTGIGQVNKR